MALPDSKTETTVLPKQPLLPRLLTGLTWLAFIVLLWVSIVQTNFRIEDLWGGVRDFFLFFRNLWPPDWRALPEIWDPLVETLVMAYLGTVFGVLLGIPWLFWSSRNTSPNSILLWFSRTLMTVLRSIPDLLYAAVFVAILSLGPLPGIAAITVFTLSILAKLGSEYVEAIEPGPLEALRATGANGTQVILYGVIPQVAPSMISYILYIFEVNVRASTVLGFVGAGGIGELLNRYIALFDYPAIMVLLIMTFVLVAAIDSVSALVRARLT